MMNFFQAQKLGLKKIRFSKGKSLFVIIPIALMFAIIVVAASEATNLITVAHNSIFSPIQSQNQVLELNKSSSSRPQDVFNGTADSGYTTTDNTLISGIANVEQVSMISTLPITNIKTTDLFSDNTITITNIAGLNPEYAKLYTSGDFQYQEGQPIPIILNANDFIVGYQDWQGKTEIAVDYTKVTDPTQADALTAQSPQKTKALSYNRADLIGKTITVEFGGLDAIAIISQESTTTGFKYTQKTQDAITAEIAARKTALEKYWDYTRISTPISYTFLVVGISEGTDKTMTFVPATFAQKLMQDYVSYEASARNTTAIPSADQNATYLGLVYDGVTVKSDTTSTLYAGIRNQVTSQVTGQINNINSQIDNQNSQIGSANAQNRRLAREFNNSANSGGGDGPPGGDFRRTFRMPSLQTIGSVSKIDAANIKITYPGQATTYNIPGLIYSKDRTSNEITGEYTGFTATQAVPLQSSTILIKIKDIASRDQVVTDLNAKGYNYQDFSQYKQYDKLESYLYLILEIGSLVFMVVTGLFILINMAKFVSEGRKEIGIFRAIGANKGDIRLIFMQQSLSFIIISILAGSVIGIIAVVGLSNVMVGSAQSFINSAVGSSVILSGNIVTANFLNFDYRTILIYAGGLLLVTLIVALIPSSQAARVSPVEAIRNS